MLLTSHKSSPPPPPSVLCLLVNLRGAWACCYQAFELLPQWTCCLCPAGLLMVINLPSQHHVGMIPDSSYRTRSTMNCSILTSTSGGECGTKSNWLSLTESSGMNLIRVEDPLSLSDLWTVLRIHEGKDLPRTPHDVFCGGHNICGAMLWKAELDIAEGTKRDKKDNKIAVVYKGGRAFTSCGVVFLGKRNLHLAFKPLHRLWIIMPVAEKSCLFMGSQQSSWVLFSFDSN